MSAIPARQKTQQSPAWLPSSCSLTTISIERLLLSPRQYRLTLAFTNCFHQQDYHLGNLKSCFDWSSPNRTGVKPPYEIDFVTRSTDEWNEDFVHTQQ